MFWKFCKNFAEAHMVKSFFVKLEDSSKFTKGRVHGSIFQWVWEFFWNNYFIEHCWMAASENNYWKYEILTPKLHHSKQKIFETIKVYMVC